MKKSLKRDLSKRFSSLNLLCGREPLATHIFNLKEKKNKKKIATKICSAQGREKQRPWELPKLGAFADAENLTAKMCHSVSVNLDYYSLPKQ